MNEKCQICTLHPGLCSEHQPEPSTAPIAAGAREWLLSKDLEMLLGSHIGVSGKYLCELLEEFAAEKKAEDGK